MATKVTTPKSADLKKYQASVSTVQKIKNTLDVTKNILTSNQKQIANLKARIQAIAAKKGVKGLNSLDAADLSKLKASYNQLVVKQKAQATKYSSYSKKYAQIVAMMQAAKKALDAVTQAAKKAAAYATKGAKAAAKKALSTGKAVAASATSKLKAFASKYNLLGKKGVKGLGDLSDLGVGPIVLAVAAVTALAAAVGYLLNEVQNSRDTIVGLNEQVTFYEQEEVEEEEPVEEEVEEEEVEEEEVEEETTDEEAF